MLDEIAAATQELRASDLSPFSPSPPPLSPPLPLAVRERIEPDELADQGWIVGPRSVDAPEFGAWPGIAEPRITFTARDWPTRLGLVAAGLGVALVPGIAAEAVPRGVRWIPINDDAGGLRRAVWAATTDDPSAAATAMVRALEEEVSS